MVHYNLYKPVCYNKANSVPIDKGVSAMSLILLGYSNFQINYSLVNLYDLMLGCDVGLSELIYRLKAGTI